MMNPDPLPRRSPFLAYTSMLTTEEPTSSEAWITAWEYVSKRESSSDAGAAGIWLNGSCSSVTGVAVTPLKTVSFATFINPAGQWNQPVLDPHLVKPWVEMDHCPGILIRH